MNIDERCINALRLLSVDMVQEANSGHPGMPMGAAAMAYVLWTRFLKHNPRNPLWPDRDRFVLSAGHGSALLYSLLHLSGYALSLEDLGRFRQWGSKTPGHPERGETPGVEATTGPLGQGFAAGVGMAMAEKFLASAFNRPGFDIVDHRVFGIVSDGDLMEGVAAEAASLAGHLRLGKIVFLYDNNGISLAGETKLTFTEDVGRRFEALGWQVLFVQNGNDPEAVAEALEAARIETGRPSLISVRTHIGYGSPRRQDTFEAHGSPLGPEEVAATKKNLGWPPQPRFHIPPECLDRFRRAVSAGEAAEQAWREKLADYERAYPELHRRWIERIEGRLPSGWEEALPKFPADPKGMATRAAGGRVLNALASRIPGFFGGSADLNPSTNTALKGRGNFQNPLAESQNPVQGAEEGPWDYSGANLAFGVREHAMGSILNGVALHGGALPFGSTFLVFSDYLRPAIRLAAIMKLPVVYVFTHDSVALGEDGPTHQPVEHLFSLRAIPGLTVIRPADANEAAEAWKVALDRREGPTALIFSRQNLPILDRSRLAPAAELARGAYILADCAPEKPRLILIATGSEVHPALEARERMRGEGLAVRVVNLPSFELFEEQERAYRDGVLPPEIPRLSVEAGSTLGWHKYLGPRGAAIGIDRFGASAPGQTLLEKFGFTVENILREAKELLRQE